MKNIRIRKIIPLVLITGVLTLSGCESKESIQKNTLITEEDTIKNETSESITEEQAKKIAKKSFKKYFNEEVDIENLFEHIELVKERDMNNDIVRESWEVEWSTFDRNRLKNIGKMTEYEIKQLDKDREGYKSYYVAIEKKNGNIINISTPEAAINQGRSLDEMKDIKIEINDLKRIASEYIKKNKLLDNLENLEFVGDVSTEPYGSLLSYRTGEDKGISVSVEYISKKVVAFVYHDEQWLKDVMGIN